MSFENVQGVTKKTLFSGFYTPGGHATISRDVDQSKTLSNTLYWGGALILYAIAQFYTSGNTGEASQ